MDVMSYARSEGTVPAPPPTTEPMCAASFFFMPPRTILISLVTLALETLAHPTSRLAQTASSTASAFMLLAAPLAPLTTSRRCNRRVYNSSMVCHSALLANAPRTSMMHRAHQNLCHKLGLLQDNIKPLVAALQEYFMMFSGPLPTEAIKALTAIFRLKDDVFEAMDHALVELAGEGGVDTQERLEPMVVCFRTYCFILCHFGFLC